MLKQVEQKHRSGCGPAALACVLGISYEKALKLIHPKKREQRQKVRANLIDISVALDIKHISHSIKNPRKWSPPKCNAIVAVKIKTSLLEGRHWVVWDANQKTFIDSKEEYYKRNGYHISYAQYVAAYNRGSKYYIEIK
jgi:hypothetical protein